MSGTTVWQKKMAEKKRQAHLKRLQLIENRKPGSPGTIDTSPPPPSIKSGFNARREFIKEQVDYHILKEERLLHERILKINTAPSKYSDKDYRPLTKVESFRDVYSGFQRVKKDKENKTIIKNIEPYYRKEVWSKDYEKQLELHKFIRRVPYKRSSNYKEPWEIRDGKQLSDKSKLNGESISTSFEGGDDDDDNNWLNHFLQQSSNESSTTSHVGNIRKVKDANAKRPATTGMIKSSSICSSNDGGSFFIENSVDDYNGKVFEEDNLSNYSPKLSQEIDSIPIINSLDIKMNNSFCLSNHEAIIKEVSNSTPSKLRRSFSINNVNSLFDVDLTLLTMSTMTGVSATSSSSGPTRRKSMRPVEKIDLLSIRRSVRVVDQNLIDPIDISDVDSTQLGEVSVSNAAAAVRKAFKISPDYNCGSQHSGSNSNNNSLHSLPFHRKSSLPPLEAPIIGGLLLPTDITCWIIRGEPVLVLSIVAYEGKHNVDVGNSHHRDSFDISHHISQYNTNHQSNSNNAQRIIELETEINLKDLSGLLSSTISRHEASEEVGFIEELLQRISRKHGILRGKDLEMLQRFACDLAFAVELSVQRGEKLSDARVVLNVAADAQVHRDSFGDSGGEGALSGEADGGRKAAEMEKILLPDKSRILLQRGALISIVILNMPANRSFNADEMGGQDFTSSVIVNKPPVTEKVYCLVKIKATPDDQLLVQAHTIQQSEFRRGRSKWAAVQAGITLSQLFSCPTAILSALVEDSYAMAMEKESYEENKEIIAAFVNNLQQSIQIEHNWRTGKNSLGVLLNGKKSTVAAS